METFSPVRDSGRHGEHIVQGMSVLEPRRSKLVALRRTSWGPFPSSEDFSNVPHSSCVHIPPGMPRRTWSQRAACAFSLHGNYRGFLSYSQKKCSVVDFPMSSPPSRVLFEGTQGLGVHLPVRSGWCNIVSFQSCALNRCLALQQSWKVYVVMQFHLGDLSGVGPSSDIQLSYSSVVHRSLAH